MTGGITFMYRIGIDVGGTFTDVTLLNSETGKYYTYKLSSTLQDQSIAIANGAKETLELYGVPVSEIEYFGHGTTVATNMIIERKGAKTALITTKGFRDLLEIGRQTRPSLYNTQEDKPETLVRRSLRTEIDERVTADGTILRAARREEIIPLLKKLKAEGVESVAVCFLFSFLNSANEKEVEECIREVWPEVYYSVSSTILPEFREFERLSTTVINSYLGPRMKMYINNLKQRVKDIGVTVEPYITQSNGGVMSISSTVQTPVQTALSGPSAGVMGAIYVAGAAGYENIITYDMGGTSTDVSLVNRGIAEYTTKRKVCGLPSGVPMIDVHAVGAGGGSIAYIDNAGALKVGPKSAGATPGPACYMRGGENPCVTDANIVLGKLNQKKILGGRMDVDIELARKAIKEKICDKSDLSPEQAANGIVTVVNSNMVRAIRSVSVEKGYDVREFSLMAFGGAGPLHACEVAKELGMREVLIPPHPGTLCSLGLLLADTKFDLSRTKVVTGEAASIDTVNEQFANMVAQGTELLDKEGVPNDRRVFQFSIDMRYQRQNFEINIAVPGGVLTEEMLEKALADFHAEHKRSYGYCKPEATVQFVSYRVSAIGIIDKPDLKPAELHPEAPIPAPIEVRKVLFQGKTEYVDAPVYKRDEFVPGQTIPGPCICEQMDTTLVVPEGWTIHVDGYHNLKIKDEVN